MFYYSTEINLLTYLLTSLITFFATEDAKDATAKGYARKISERDFVDTVYMLMDVLPIISKLSLLFQRKN